jgi:hypothetical protein
LAAILPLVTLEACGKVSQSSATTGDKAAVPQATSMPRTLWGEPDLQGIWSRDADIPLQRPAKYGDREFFTDEERAELDRRIADIVSRDTTEGRRARRTEGDVNAEFSQTAWTSRLPVGKRTSLIVDPPDGKIPPLTPEAQKARDARREFQVALMQATEACRKQMRSCAGGRYGPVSSRRNETPPLYVFGGIANGINRADGPEDRGMAERCLMAAVPDFGTAVSGFRRIVQARGQVALYYDGISGIGWSRNIPVTMAPHLPPTVRQWWGDSRGRWEGNTFVVDVTNFSPKSDFQGAHDQLHLVERWTRLDADTLEYIVTVDDPTTWTRSWTARQELKKQSEMANHVYYEPRCHEGNYGLVGVLAGARAAETAFTERRGPDPGTLCSSFAGCGGFDFGFADDGPDANPLR